MKIDLRESLSVQNKFFWVKRIFNLSADHSIHVLGYNGRHILSDTFLQGQNGPDSSLRHQAAVRLEILDGLSQRLWYVTLKVCVRFQVGS